MEVEKNKKDSFDVKYGLFNLRKERDMARSSLDYILHDIQDIECSDIVQFRLGFHLNEFEQFKYYEDYGYDNFYEFCLKNFGFDKSYVSRCIGVWSCFSAKNGDVKTMFIDEKWKAYSFSKLSELLPLMPLDAAKLSELSPDLTVKQIRELKKKWKSKTKVKDVPVPFDVLIENGSLMSEIFSYLDKYFKKNEVSLCMSSMTNKQLIFEHEGKSYRLLLCCPKE